MKKIIIPILAVLSFVASDGYAQSRVNRETESFTSSTKILGVVSQWTLSTNGSWQESKSNHYEFYNTKNLMAVRDEGFHEINLISFSDGGKEVYAFEYAVGYYDYRYENIRLDPRYFTRPFYYFISQADLSKIASLEEGELEVSFFAHLDMWRHDNQDDLIREYKSGKQIEGNFTARLRVTEQDGRKVLRFTVPYDDRQKKDSVFESGPYYEIRYSTFSRIKKRIKKQITE